MFSINPKNWSVFSSDSKSKPVATETKSLNVGNTPGIPDCSDGSFISFLQQGANFDLSFYTMIHYYETCGPLADAIDKVAQEVQTIQPLVWDKKEERFVDHPIDELINYPHADISREDFLFGLCAMYLLTGNVFPYVSLGARKRPLEMNFYSPQFVNLEADFTDGFIEFIRTNGAFGTANQELYTRSEDMRRFRYLNKEESAQVWPIRRFNPRGGSGNQLYGLSPINSIFLEIEQYIASSRHNLSLLKRGARPGGTFSTTSEIPLTDEQFARMQDQIDKYYVGENNAGRPLLMENTEWKESIVNNRDMDYGTMRKNIQAMIYNRLNIPLPSISGENMTLANMDVAKLNLYDNAVMPVTKVIFNQLGNFLFPLYDGVKGAQRYELRFDEAAIPALQLRRNEVIKLRKEISVNTDNELRRGLGDDPIVGGDVVYKPNNMVPVGIDEDPRDVMGQTTETDETSGEAQELPATASKAYQDYFNTMRKQLDVNGNRVFSDKEIITKADKYGIN